MRNYRVSPSLAKLFTIMLDEKSGKDRWQKKARLVLKKAWRGKKTSICLDDCMGLLDHTEYTLGTLDLYGFTPRELALVSRSGWAFYRGLFFRASMNTCEPV